MLLQRDMAEWFHRYNGDPEFQRYSGFAARRLTRCCGSTDLKSRILIMFGQLLDRTIDRFSASLFLLSGRCAEDHRHCLASQWMPCGRSHFEAEHTYSLFLSSREITSFVSLSCSIRIKCQRHDYNPTQTYSYPNRMLDRGFRTEFVFLHTSINKKHRHCLTFSKRKVSRKHTNVRTILVKMSVLHVSVTRR